MENTSVNRAKVIRKALRSIYGQEVRVRKGSGTASTWTEIFIPREWITNGKADRGMALDLALMALKKAGLSPTTYTADDGYDSTYEEILVSAI